MARVPAEAMAYSSRDAKYVMNVHGRWEIAAEDQPCIAWAREFFAKSTAVRQQRRLHQLLTQDETERIESAYGADYERLAKLKKKYDPTNLFRMNQNIRPA